MISPADDLLHRGSDDPYWNESAWFGFTVPERTLTGWVYSYHRPHQGCSVGGVALWDPTGEHPWDCLHYDWGTPVPLPPGAEMYDFALDNGLRVHSVEPPRSFELGFRGEGCELAWDALAEPRSVVPPGVLLPRNHTAGGVARGDFVSAVASESSGFMYLNRCYTDWQFDGRSVVGEEQDYLPSSRPAACCELAEQAVCRYRRTVQSVTPEPRVLVIGLDPYRVPGPWDPAPVVDAIAVGMARFRAAGVGAESCLFGIDGGDDIEAVVTEALDRRRWEVVVVGGGVRDRDDLLGLFERLINLVRRHAPGAAIAFTNGPTDTFDAAARWLSAP